MAGAHEVTEPLSPHGTNVDPAKAPVKGSWLTRKFPFLGTKKGLIITVIVILVIIGGGLAGLAALPKKDERGGGGAADSATADAITSDVHFYGQSPPVYPSRTFTLRVLGFSTCEANQPPQPICPAPASGLKPSSRPAR